MCNEQPTCSLTASYKATDAADILKVSKRTVQHYITEGRLKAHVVGNSYRIFGRDIIKFWNLNYR